MENLKQLEEFGGVKNVSDFNWFITNHGTCCYSIVVGSKDASRPGRGLRKLEDLGCKNNELVLYGSNVRDDKLLAERIAHLKIGEYEGLSQCFVDDLASRFDNPTSLRSLDIRRCGGIECIWRSDLHGVGLQASQASENLEVIWLEDLYDLKGVVVMMQRGEIGASTIAPAQLLVFSSLKTLFIRNCNKMRKVGLPVSGVPNLEDIHILDCGEIEEIFEEDEGTTTSVVTTLTLPKLKKLILEDLPRLRKVRLSILGASNLELIEIRNCKEIEEIFEDEERDSVTTILKLQILILGSLPRLKKVGLAASVVPNIEHIEIWSCEEIEEIFKEDEGRDAVPKLKKLKVLKLTKLPRLRKLGLPLSRAPNLEKFSIENCGIEEIFEEDEGRNPVTTFSKIQYLRLCKLPRVKKLGLPASALPNLGGIDITDCEEIEEMFEDEGRDVVATLPKLNELRLSGNPRLRKVGLAASGVPNLVNILIWECGEIEEILKEGDEGRAASIIFHKLQVLSLAELPRLRSVSNATMICNSIERMHIEKFVK